MCKGKKRLCVALIITFIIGVIFIQFNLYYYDYVFVDYVASYEIDREIETNSFSGHYSVGTLKATIEQKNFINAYGELDGLQEKLDKLDNHTRIVFAEGSGIRYFFIPKGYEDYDGFIRVKYISKEPQNMIYIYTTDYEGAMVDFTNY